MVLIDYTLSALTVTSRGLIPQTAYCNSHFGVKHVKGNYLIAIPTIVVTTGIIAKKTSCKIGSVFRGHSLIFSVRSYNIHNSKDFRGSQSEDNGIVVFDEKSDSNPASSLSFEIIIDL